MKTLVVVDCQNDFIDGSLACLNAKEAVENIISVINTENFDRVVYSLDWHRPTNNSFEINGGVWPVHCVADSKGAKLSCKFDKINNDKFKPKKENLYKKGMYDKVEEYSAYNAMNVKEERIHEIETDEFIVCGIASEFCIRETVLELFNNGKKVSLYLDGVGYVNKEDHEKNIQDLKDKGIQICEY